MLKYFPDLWPDFHIFLHNFAFTVIDKMLLTYIPILNNFMHFFFKLHDSKKN